MKRFAVILILLLIMLVPAGHALAAPLFGIVVEEGEVYEKDITIVGDELIVKEGARVEGNVTIAGGTAEIAGEIDGDLTVFGGDVTLSGRVDGVVTTMGGHVTVTEDAEIGGECVIFGGHLEDNNSRISCATTNFPGHLNFEQIVPPPEIPVIPSLPGTPEVMRPSLGTRLMTFLFRVGEAVGRSMLLAFVAFLISSLMPDQLRRVSATVRNSPAASGAVGFLTIVAGPSMLVLLLVLSAVLTLVCIGLLGFPLVLILGVALLAAAVFGWITMGNLLGEAIANALHMKHASLPLTATLGTLTLTLVLSLLGTVRFFPGEGVVAFLLLCFGLGATALTQFGTKRYPPPTVPAESAPPGTPRGKAGMVSAQEPLSS